jgi:hypothetical protein
MFWQSIASGLEDKSSIVTSGSSGMEIQRFLILYPAFTVQNVFLSTKIFQEKRGLFAVQ